MQIIKTWLPAVTGMVCFGLGSGLMGIYGFFVEPISREFGAGVALLNLGPVALLLVPAILGASIGRLADRMPTRRILFAGATLAMLSLIALGQAPTLGLVALAFLSFSLGLTLYGPVVVNGLMVRIYPGREARALAVAAMGISFAAASLPPAVGHCWRTWAGVPPCNALLRVSWWCCCWRLQRARRGTSWGPRPPVTYARPGRPITIRHSG
ncbi:MAG: hypothetical protein R3E50_08835 [Halioglobus sp.]